MARPGSKERPGGGTRQVKGRLGRVQLRCTIRSIEDGWRLNSVSCAYDNSSRCISRPPSGSLLNGRPRSGKPVSTLVCFMGFAGMLFPHQTAAPGPARATGREIKREGDKTEKEEREREREREQERERDKTETKE